MKKIFFLSLLSAIAIAMHAQNAGISIDSPKKRLSVNGSIVAGL